MSDLTRQEAETLHEVLRFLLEIVRRDAVVHNMNVLGITEEAVGEALVALARKAGK